MSGKLNRDEILRGILQTLVDGWGHGAVSRALQSLAGPAKPGQPGASNPRREADEGAAVQLIAEMEIPADRKTLLLDLAKRYDEGTAFPKISDVRSVLIAHQQNAKDLKTRTQAFKRLIPVLSGMSEKGLEKLISRSHHSGPAELEDISRAIRGAGEDLRGKRENVQSAAISETGRSSGDTTPPDEQPDTSSSEMNDVPTLR